MLTKFYDKKKINWNLKKNSMNEQRLNQEKKNKYNK